MATHKFFRGNRVVVYATLIGESVRSKGTVLGAYPDKLLIEMDSVLTAKEIWAHPKQCRRLKPKRRREFWITFHDCSEPRLHPVHRPEMICGSGCKIEWVRVREVKVKP